MGLKSLGERDGLLFRAIDGVHMEIPDVLLSAMAKEFLGSKARPNVSSETEADLVLQAGFHDTKIRGPHGSIYS